MNTLAWIGFCQSLFTAILMFTKKEPGISDKVLSGWMVLLSVDFLFCGINYEIFHHPLLISSFLLFNPALYLYVSSLVKPSFRLHPLQLLHLIPFVSLGIYSYIIKQPVKLSTFFSSDNTYFFRVIFGITNILSWCIYNPLSIILVHRYRMRLHDELSNIERNEKLGWVMSVAIFYVSYCILAIFLSIITITVSLNPLTPHIYNYSVLLVLVYIMSFYGLRQTKMNVSLTEEQKAIPYKHSLLTPDEKEKIKQKILLSFEKEHIYLQSDLNMQILSEKIKVPKYQITEVLNTIMGLNFFRFVNRYRVEAVKEMLMDPKNKYSIESIGYECGFSSKSSFFTVFKDITGQTPDVFRKKHVSTR